MLSRFTRLDSLLTRYQSLWRFEPFQLSGEPQERFLSDYPELYQWLAQLSTEDISSFKQDTEALLLALSAFLPELSKLHGLCDLPVAKAETITLPRGFDAGIPGRKMAQILAMSQYALGHHDTPGQDDEGEWLEWCSGKGYLGRILAQRSQQPVTSLEWQQSLCDSGQQEADAKKLPMTFIQGDAFSDSSRAIFRPNQHAVALHACGDLHVQLLKNSIEKGLRTVTISPCCYHLIRDDVYQPLSKPAMDSKLSFTKQDLRIPLQETVTGGERVKKHRQQEMSYRLGFDLLLKAETQHKEYMSVPSIKKSELANGFEYFCRWAADKKGIQLPETDFNYWFNKGEERFWNMERLSLIQQVFRRPLELWLVMDRALFLQENGYRVEVSVFCDRAVTPRNVLIHGCLRS